MGLFEWSEAAVPVRERQGPPRPLHIVTDEAFGLELLETAAHQGWSDRWHVRSVETGTTQRLSQVATWGEFHGVEEYLTDEQQRQCDAWWTGFAAEERN